MIKCKSIGSDGAEMLGSLKNSISENDEDS